MSLLKIVLSSFAFLCLQSIAAYASPAETNYFILELSGADAENFRRTSALESSSFYGEENNHIMKNFSFSFSIGTKGEKGAFNFSLECQQRTLNYLTEAAKSLAPTCSFSYFTPVVYTNIDMTAEISKKMIKSLKWTEYKNSGRFFFGCYDGMAAGCPTINYSPANDQREAGVRVSFYKP